MSAPNQDTHPAIQARMDAAYRRMSVQDKVRRMAALTETGYTLALAQIRAQYPNESEREHRVRLLARSAGPELVKAAFGWEPSER